MFFKQMQPRNKLFKEFVNRPGFGLSKDEISYGPGFNTRFVQKLKAEEPKP